MYLLLSGEGPGDIGVCNPSAACCDRLEFSEGPMAVMVDQLVEVFQGFEMSHLETERVSYVSESYLSDNKLPPRRKAMAFRGKKRPPETKYYFENARALAAAAKAKAEVVSDRVIAVLFRDADGTASAGRGNWADKRQSMIEGFKAEQFQLGVPMVPKPKSEAWLLCATKTNPYQHCAALENESGNDRAGRTPLKDQLSTSLDGDSGTVRLNQLVKDKTIDVARIDMPSFNAFKEDLQRAINLANGVGA
jgi:hypothetical protein